MATVQPTCTTVEQDVVAEVQSNNWTSLFCKNVATNFTASCNYVKKFLALVVSGVTYMKKIFPEDAYGNRKIDDLVVKILSSDSKNESVQDVIRLLYNAFEALEEEYMKEFRIVITDASGDKEIVVSEISLHLDYDPDGKFVKCNCSDDSGIPQSTKETTLAALRNLNALKDQESSAALLSKGKIYFFISYDYEKTPIEYEPTGFEPSDSSRCPKTDKLQKVRIGKVKTPFHSSTLFWKVPRSVDAESSHSQDNDDEKDTEPGAAYKEDYASASVEALQKLHIVEQEDEDDGAQK